MSAKKDSWLTKTNGKPQVIRKYWYRIGTHVRHSRWGIGTIERFEPTGGAYVRFNRDNEVRLVQRSNIKPEAP